ncbi:MAG: hypothetical protein P8L31_12145 [Pseudomonadales bacterium]|nr:hypothetical protein [Pseudomonadales bacterium]
MNPIGIGIFAKVDPRSASSVLFRSRLDYDYNRIIGQSTESRMSGFPESVDVAIHDGNRTLAMTNSHGNPGSNSYRAFRSAWIAEKGEVG